MALRDGNFWPGSVFSSWVTLGEPFPGWTEGGESERAYAGTREGSGDLL